MERDTPEASDLPRYLLSARARLGYQGTKQNDAQSRVPKRDEMTETQRTPLDLALQDARDAYGAGRMEAALAASARARALGAPARQTARQDAMALSALGRHGDAVAALRPLSKAAGKDYGFLNLYGVMLKRAGQLGEAREVLEQAVRLTPGAVAGWQNLGNVLEALGDTPGAVKAFAKGLGVEPGSAELWRLQARALATLGQTGKALESVRKARALAPDNAAVAALLIDLLQRAGLDDEARALAERLQANAPDTPEFSVIEARRAFRAGDSARALALLEGLIDAHPGHLEGNLLLAHVLGDGDRAGANAAYARAVEANPDALVALDRWIDSLARSRHGNEVEHLENAYAQAKLLMERFPDRVREAARALRTVLMRVLDEDRFAQTGTLDRLLPRWLAEGSHSAVHYELGQVQTLDDRLKLVDWHRDWGRKASAGIRPVWETSLHAAFAAPPLATGRKLRIGFMSSDLRSHPVTYFALPLLEGYDRERVEVFCYSFYEREPDRVQQHIAGKVTAFRHWPKRPNARVAEGIAADNLDMLFELGGSTAMNKLMVMAHRPARIGASWLGYPHSAGLEQIDMILTDPYIRPDDPRLLIERPFEMPESWVAMSRMFGPHEIAEATPEARKGHLTFGTANNPYKFTPACLDAWAEVLRAVPGSRFVFLRPEAGAESFIANSRAAFAKRDVDPDRLDFIGVRGDHMRHYNEIDIALDSLPHVGGTTTCEALWMGVPTVSLVGPGFPERLSYSNLSNAGLGDLAVFSVADYVATAAALAEDRARRTALRHGLRAQIRANPLGQPERFTAAFYDLARKVASE
jgi:protein O-GlcNAc transferase